MPIWHQRGEGSAGREQGLRSQEGGGADQMGGEVLGKQRGCSPSLASWQQHPKAVVVCHRPQNETWCLQPCLLPRAVPVSPPSSRQGEGLVPARCRWELGDNQDKETMEGGRKATCRDLRRIIDRQLTRTFTFPRCNSLSPPPLLILTLPSCTSH